MCPAGQNQPQLRTTELDNAYEKWFKLQTNENNFKLQLLEFVLSKLTAHVLLDNLVIIQNY